MKYLICTLFIFNASNQVFAGYENVFEKVNSLQIIPNSRCSSGFAAKARSWNYSYCTTNLDDPPLLRKGYLQACIRYEGYGQGNGHVYIYEAVNAALRIFLGCSEEICEQEPSAKCNYPASPF